MGVGHYENFPVASILLPRELRKPVQVLYHFAREADDIADEGDQSTAERLQALNFREAELRRIAQRETPKLPLYQALAEVIRERQLPIEPFCDLLDAFKQDVTTTRYASFDQVLDYCARSANPVGRLMLRLFRVDDQPSARCSDNICSSLQLINFLQDVAVDFRKGRVYMAQDELSRFGVAESLIARGQATTEWRAFMRYQIERARQMLFAGAPLGRTLTGRIGLELRMIIAGGARILEKLTAAEGDVFAHRPTLTKADWLRMSLRAALSR